MSIGIRIFNLLVICWDKRTKYFHLPIKATSGLANRYSETYIGDDVLHAILQLCI